jgi:hypothetical protein
MFQSASVIGKLKLVITGAPQFLMRGSLRKSPTLRAYVPLILYMHWLGAVTFSLPTKMLLKLRFFFGTDSDGDFCRLKRQFTRLRFDGLLGEGANSNGKNDDNAA